MSQDQSRAGTLYAFVMGGLIFALISLMLYVGWNYGASVALGLPTIGYKNAMACGILMLTLLLVAKTIFRLESSDEDERRKREIEAWHRAAELTGSTYSPFRDTRLIADAIEEALTLDDMARIVNRDMPPEVLSRIRSELANTLVARIEEKRKSN